MSRRKIETLSMWDWTVLVAAWRYYENRHTIASVGFPDDIIERYFGPRGKKDYTDDVRKTIANQFANVDHYSRGLDDWKDDGFLMSANDFVPWRRMYCFLKAYADDSFRTVVACRDGKTEEIKCFEYDGEYYPADKYVEHPGSGWRVAPEFIKEVK